MPGLHYVPARGKMATTANPANSNWKDLLPYLNDDEQAEDCMVTDQMCFLAGMSITSATCPEYRRVEVESDFFASACNLTHMTSCAVGSNIIGDNRRNTQPGLAAMHTVWVRMHNYIEENLHSQNPDWNGETLFQVSTTIHSNTF